MKLGIRNSDAIGERQVEKIDSELSYSPSLGTAVKLILENSAFAGERETPSFKFIRAARFLKNNAPWSCGPRLPSGSAYRRSRVSDPRDGYRDD